MPASSQTTAPGSNGAQPLRRSNAAATTDAGDNAGLRRIRPRRGLPGGRAVVGGLLVAVAAVGTFAAVSGANQGPTSRYVVAAREIPPGKVLREADLEVVAIDLPERLQGRVFPSTDAVVGAVAVGPIGPGELVQAGQLADGTDAEIPTFSIAVAQSDANAGELTRGDFVQVFATYGTDTTAATVALSSDARIVSVSGEDDRLTSAGQVVVRLAVSSSEERSAIINAAITGRLTLVRTSGAEDVEVTPSYRPPADVVGARGDSNESADEAQNSEPEGEG